MKRPRRSLAVALLLAGAVVALIAYLTLRPFKPSREACAAQKTERSCQKADDMEDGPQCVWALVENPDVRACVYYDGSGFTG